MKFLGIFFILIITNLVNTLFAQNSFDVKFDDGRTATITMEYDNPTQMSRWRVGASLFGYNSVEKQKLSLFLRGEYRAHPRLYFEGSYGFPVDIALDNTEIIKNEDSRFKNTTSITLVGHITLIGKNSIMERSVDIDNNMSRAGSYNSDGNMDWGSKTIWLVTIPRKVNNSLLLDFGINSLIHPANVLLKNSNPSDFGSYFMPTHNSISLQTGFSYYRAQSFRFNSTNSKTIRHIRYSRFYANVLYSVVNSGKIYYQSTTGLADKEVTAGYKDPKKENIGFLCGFVNHYDIRNSVHTAWLGFQYGFLPNISIDRDPPAGFNSSSQATHFTIQIGLTLGGRIDKKRQ